MEFLNQLLGGMQEYSGIDFKRLGLAAYSRTRSAVYSSESLVLPLAEALVLKKRPRFPFDDRQLFQNVRFAMEKLLREDIDRIRRGVYPSDVLLKSQSIDEAVAHLRRVPRLFFDAMRATQQRRDNNPRVFAEEAQELLREAPEYYRRNFHFQADGYLSRRSAELYEHQVEVLFGGCADAMRRLIIEPMRKHFGSSDGEGLRFLEIGAGTGRAALFVRLAFPRAKIVLVDLSGPYLKQAQLKLSGYSRFDFYEGDAAQLPFQDSQFDAVYSVFLFHELPMAARRAVLHEAMRVCNAGGFFGFVDSLQCGDQPQFDSALERFPVDFHEPFYRSYIENPMSALLSEAGFSVDSEDFGFLAKVVASHKRNVG